jgi:ribonucleotide reductase alpha subunit
MDAAYRRRGGPIWREPMSDLPRGLTDPSFDPNALRVLKERYFARKDDGTAETPKEFLWRVASSIAKPERPYASAAGRDADAVVDGVAHAFYDMLARRDFMPNTPCLVNAGRPLSMLSACFVLPVPDSIEGIFYNLKAMALVQKAGGGTGFAFSELRANGSLVESTGKDASGPVSFMKVFNAATDSIKQGGVRRGANMGVLRVDHPDVFAFMQCKKELDSENRALYNRMSDTGRYTPEQLTHIKQELLQTQINNFNISIGVTDAFMDAVERDADFDLIDGKTKAVVRTVKAREIWDALVEGAWQNGEPGVLFLDHPEWNPLPGLGPIHATNPCVTGETLVAVADGRGHVPIAQLATEGKDVPVYCYDDRGSITVRTMRHPRVTGKGKAILMLTLDDGSTVRATENHKFRLRDGSYKELRDLQPGDSLKVMTRFQASIRDIFPNANSRSQDYWWVNNGKATNQLEHRYIAEHHYDAKIPKGSVVHHVDFNAQNNAPENLQIMTKAEHDALHAQTMLGDANPMRRAKTEWSPERLAAYAEKHRIANSGEGNPRFGGITNMYLRSEAMKLTLWLGRRFSLTEWEDFARRKGLPTQFSNWRSNHLNGGLIGLAKWAALELGFDHIDADPRVVRHYQEAVAAGYDASIDENGALFVTKRCEGCGSSFNVAYVYREIAFCSHACGTVSANKRRPVIAKRQASRRVTLDRKAAELREKQLDVYTELKATRPIVLKQDWVERCRERNISVEIARKSSPFRTYADLQEAAATFNHRVVAIEFDEYEDVYNGTVDDFHNFFVGGFESLTKHGKQRINYINSLQCGEQALHGYDSCNLGSLNVGHFYDAAKNDVDWDRLAQNVSLAIRFLDNVIDANLYPIDEIREMVTNNRRVGLGIMGFADLLIQLRIAYGSPASIDFAAKLMNFIQTKAIDTSEHLARERGEFPNKHLSVWKDDPRPRRNAALLSIAPTGTISMIAGCSFGCEPYFGMAYTKHVMKDAEGRPQHLYYVVPLFEEIAKDEGFYSEELLGKIEENRGSLKGIPQVPQFWQDVFTTSADVTVDQHIDILAAFQRYTCNAVSKCVAAGTLIPTNKGLIKIEDFGSAPVGEFGTLNDDYSVVGHDGEWHRVTGFYRNGRVPTIKVRTKNGATLEASETHHVMTLDGWKAMKDLTLSDMIVGRFEEQAGAGGEYIDTAPFPFRNTATPLTLPNVMSVDLALWLGMIAADGHTVESTGNVGISEKDAAGDVARVFDDLCERLFGLRPYVQTDKRTGVRTRYLSSRALSRYTAALVGKGARTKHVPEAILRGSSAEKIAFLNGVTLDGFLTRGALVIYSGTSAALADGIEALCRSLGAPSCWRWTETKSTGYLVHQVRVSNELQGLLQPIETRKHAPALETQRLVRTPREVYDLVVPHKHSEFSNLRSVEERQVGYCAVKTLEKLAVPVVDSREYLVHVASIEYGEAETYDIEVADAHSYVVNGLVSHNTINAPNDDTRENVAKAIFRAYQAGCKGFTYYRDGSRTEQVVTFSKDADIAGVNRDKDAGKPATTVDTPAPIANNVATESLEALLARANALVGGT